MVRVEIHDSAAECVLRVSGELAGEDVRELEMCWRTASSTTHGRRTRLDVARLERLDPAGEALIEEMSRAGVDVVRTFPEERRRRASLGWLRSGARFSIFALLLAFPPAF